jgi:hypothetical protein
VRETLQLPKAAGATCGFFATYILQFAEFERKYFVMSKKNSTFVAVSATKRKIQKTNKY